MGHEDRVILKNQRGRVILKKVKTKEICERTNEAKDQEGERVTSKKRRGRSNIKEDKDK